MHHYVKSWGVRQLHLKLSIVTHLTQVIWKCLHAMDLKNRRNNGLARKSPPSVVAVRRGPGHGGHKSRAEQEAGKRYVVPRAQFVSVRGHVHAHQSEHSGAQWATRPTRKHLAAMFSPLLALPSPGPSLLFIGAHKG